MDNKLELIMNSRLANHDEWKLELIMNHDEWHSKQANHESWTWWTVNHESWMDARQADLITVNHGWAMKT